MEPITGTSPLIVARSVATWYFDNSYTLTLHTYTDLELVPRKPSYSEDHLHPLANKDACSYPLQCN